MTCLFSKSSNYLVKIISSNACQVNVHLSCGVLRMIHLVSNAAILVVKDDDGNHMILDHFRQVWHRWRLRTRRARCDLGNQCFLHVNTVQYTVNKFFDQLKLISSSSSLTVPAFLPNTWIVNKLFNWNLISKKQLGSLSRSSLAVTALLPKYCLAT